MKFPLLTLECYGGPLDGDRLAILLGPPDSANMTVMAQPEVLAPIPTAYPALGVDKPTSKTPTMLKARYRLNRPLSFALDWLEIQGKGVKEIHLEDLRPTVASGKRNQLARGLRLDYVRCE